MEVTTLPSVDTLQLPRRRDDHGQSVNGKPKQTLEGGASLWEAGSRCGERAGEGGAGMVTFPNQFE